MISRPMHIFIDAHLSEDRITGVGRYLNGLIGALIQEDRENRYTVLISDQISTDHPLSGLKAPNLRLIRTSLSGPGPAQHLTMPGLFRRLRPDIYHHPHFDLPVSAPRDSVITVHDLKYIRHPEFFPEKRRLKVFYMKWMMSRSTARAGHVIAVSESTRKDLIDLYSMPSGKITAIHHGFALNAASEHTGQLSDDASVLSRYGIKAPYLLFVGERRPHKNIPRLISAFSEVAAAEPALNLVIAGKPYKSYLEPERTVARENLADRVMISGYIAEADLPALYRGAKLLILPSLYEGFGLPLLEAMGYGTPVLGSDCAAIPEIVGDAGLLFNPLDVSAMAEAMRKGLNDGALRRKLISRGMERAARFTWRHTAQSTLKVYQTVYRKPDRRLRDQ